jgi:hypothetical protein
MGTFHRHVPRILACHCSWSCHHHFFAVGVVIGVIVIVTANANTAAQGRWGCRLAIVATVLRLIIAVVVLISAMAIAWDDDDKLPVILLHLVQFLMCGGNWPGHTSLHTLVMLGYAGLRLGEDGNCPQKLW